jgi:hypothetical protein
MVAFRTDHWRDELLGELTEAALPVAVRHGARGNSVDLDLRLARAIDQALWAEDCPDLLAGVARAAYRAVLRHGLSGPFTDLELGLWRAVRRVGADPRFADHLACA